jgi:rod shape determining protein RodA
MRSISSPISAVTSLSEDRASLRHLSLIDWGIFLSALLLSAIGIATVHSASSELAVDYLPRQALWVAVGVVVLLVVFSIDYHVLTELALLLYGAGVVALVLVLFVGTTVNGARSWLGIGHWRLQPAELMKLATLLLLARYLAGINQRHLRFSQIAAACAIVALPMLLTALQPDLGGAAMFVPILCGMLLVSGVRLRTLVAIVVVSLALSGGIFFFGLRDYQRQRILTFVSQESDPLGAGYQIRQSKIAVGSGEWGGKGYMQGTQSQLRFLPERHTDFIFAVLAEEWGFLGVATVFGLYALYIVNTARVAMRARDRAGILIVVGILSFVAFHVLYNTGMVIGLLPITGIPLPYLSYGGSFTLVNFIATGIVLGVDLRRYVNR